MKALLFSLCLLVTSNVFAADCFELQSGGENLSINLAPKEVCLSHLNTVRGGILTGKIMYNNMEMDLAVTMTDFRSLGVHFDSAKAQIIRYVSTWGSCYLKEEYTLDLEVTLDIDGSLIGVGPLKGTASATNDSCHTPLRTQNLEYKSVN